MRQLIAGNWKMHGLSASLAEIRTLERQLMDRPATAEILVAPPFTLIGRAVAEAKGAFAIGGQDCHIEPSGAFTGDISAEMLKDSGATFVILGHSERRKFHGESDKLVAAKALAARRAGLTAIICIGEKDKQRAAGNALSVCGTQLAGSIPDGAEGDNTVVAYEPVWAIGSGKTPTQAEISEMHAHIRSCLTGRFGEAGQSIRILYGGSVKPGNAEDILALPEVGGALVGGASLKASEFLQIIAAARNSG